jgi:hypothetical protein
LAVTGDEPVLVVKVKDLCNDGEDATASEISDHVLGTKGDLANMKTQFHACSMGKLKMTPGKTDSEQHESAPGVIKASISITLEGNTQSTTRNAAAAAVEDKLGISTSGPCQRIMFVVEKCHVAGTGQGMDGCNFSACAVADT